MGSAVVVIAVAVVVVETSTFVVVVDDDDVFSRLNNILVIGEARTVSLPELLVVSIVASKFSDRFTDVFLLIIALGCCCWW